MKTPESLAEEKDKIHGLVRSLCNMQSHFNSFIYFVSGVFDTRVNLKMVFID